MYLLYNKETVCLVFKEFEISFFKIFVLNIFNNILKKYMSNISLQHISFYKNFMCY